MHTPLPQPHRSPGRGGWSDSAPYPVFLLSVYTTYNLNVGPALNLPLVLCSVLPEVRAEPLAASQGASEEAQPGLPCPAQPRAGRAGVSQAQAGMPHLLSSWPHLCEPLSHSVLGSYLCSQLREKGSTQSRGGWGLPFSTIRMAMRPGHCPDSQSTSPPLGVPGVPGASGHRWPLAHT